MSAPGELVQFITATPVPPAADLPGERAPVAGREDDGRWEDDSEDEHEEREHREKDDDDEHESHEEWEVEDDD